MVRLNYEHMAHMQYIYNSRNSMVRLNPPMPIFGYFLSHYDPKRTKLEHISYESVVWRTTFV